MIDVGKDRKGSFVFESSTEMDTSKYLCQFTTLLMDTVEELTMRVSQIEFVCSQRFPDLQSLSHAIQKKLQGGSMTRDLEWKKKEDSFLHQIKQLQKEKQQSEEQINQLQSSLEETKEKLMNNELLLNSRKQNEGIISRLEEQLAQKANEVAKAKEREKDLLQQIELKDENLEEERRKRKSLFGECSKIKESYKRLKSQYTFLTSKLGDGRTNMHKNIREDTKDNKMNTPVSIVHPKQYAVNDQIMLTNNKPSCIKDAVASHWRDTRARQEPRGGDPHDDFLDTPLENLRNFNMNPQAVKQSPVSADKSKDGISSDEETQDKAHPGMELGKDTKEFKYVEPVRRKAERENLKGVECRQCQKFYDAVLPEGGDKRCEHYDGVSRHRFRYAPPSTPEGFWNIGFDSDL